MKTICGATYVDGTMCRRQPGHNDPWGHQSDLSLRWHDETTQPPTVASHAMVWLYGESHSHDEAAHFNLVFSSREKAMEFADESAGGFLVQAGNWARRGLRVDGNHTVLRRLNNRCEYDDSILGHVVHEESWQWIQAATVDTR